MSADLHDVPAAARSPVRTAACSPWGLARQVLLILVAVAALGFAGRHAWQHREDFFRLLPGSWAFALRTAIDGRAPHCSDPNCNHEFVGQPNAWLESRYGPSNPLILDAAEPVSALAPENVDSY